MRIPTTMMRVPTSIIALATLAVLAAVITTLALGGFTAQAQNEPGAVPNLQLDSASPGVLTVTWDTPDPTPSDYRLVWAEQSLGYPSYKNANEADRGNEYPGGSATSITLTGLTKGETFKVRVRSRHTSGGNNNGPWSGPWTAAVSTRIKNDPPAAPTGLTAGRVAHDSVTISWTAPGSGSAVSGYRILRGTDASNLSAIAPDTGGTGTEYTDSTVAAETTYHYGVLALSQDGDGAQSATASATTGAAPQDKGSKGSQKGDPEGSIGTRDTHAVPPNLAVEPGDGRLTFTWDEPVITSVHTIVHYSYQYGKTTDSSLTDGTVVNNPTHESPLVITGLENGTRYIFKVRVILSGGTPITGRLATIFAIPNTLLRVTSIERQVPTNSPTNADSLTWRVTFNDEVENVDEDGDDFSITGATATLMVSAVSGATGAYDVTATGDDLHDRNATVTLSFASGQDITGMSKGALTNLTPIGANDNTYVLRNPRAPDAPTNLMVEGKGTRRIELTWTAPADEGGSAIRGYKIEVSADHRVTWTVLVSNTGRMDTTYTHSGLEASTSRNYRVSAINASGTSEASNTAGATTAGTARLTMETIAVYWKADNAISGNLLLVDSCSGSKGFRASWDGPRDEGRADRWEAEITNRGDARAQSHRFSDIDGDPVYFEMNGSVSFTGPGSINIRVRGQFGTAWTTWSPRASLYCIEN